ncbi:hypothetical protein [Komarekiella delphini-convector]|nr:hypothetical protein [Komarekiella delphini-convector]
MLRRLENTEILHRIYNPAILKGLLGKRCSYAMGYAPPEAIAASHI